MEQEELLFRIGNTLNKLKIPYIITGGIAVVVWGRPRFTADIDIVIELVPQKLDEIFEELRKIDKDSYVDKKMIQDALARGGEFNFIHPSSGVKVDFWILKDELFDKSRIKRRIPKIIAGKKLYFCSPEDLVLIKLQWYEKTKSTRQLEDIESIIAIQKKLDWKYIKRWAKIQATEKFLNFVLNKTK
ncbi:MAG: hypothetical protein Q8L09_04590 [Candidatus Moranbacteria bacterium]|nr:hypothetical protein [Candidatus Moranbacteria bacterium]